MPNGKIQQEFVDTLKAIGNWLQVNGETVYGTRGNIIRQQDWGVVTGKDKSRYVHVLKKPNQEYIFLPDFNGKITGATLFSNKAKVNFKQLPEGIFIYLKGISYDPVDTIIELKMQ